MKNLLLAAALLFSTNLLAMDAYTTTDENIKNFVKRIVEVLGLPGTLDVEKKIYHEVSFVFDGEPDWNSYWLGYNDVAASKINNPDVGFIEQIINTDQHGIFFISFLYDKKANQILINTKQFRSGTKEAVLNVYAENKADTENYEVSYERDRYSMLQEKGKVSFEAFNVGVTGSVVYFNQKVIDL
jgi:hypothetical protein